MKTNQIVETIRTLQSNGFIEAAENGEDIQLYYPVANTWIDVDYSELTFSVGPHGHRIKPKSKLVLTPEQIFALRGKTFVHIRTGGSHRLEAVGTWYALLEYPGGVFKVSFDDFSQNYKIV